MQQPHRTMCPEIGFNKYSQKLMHMQDGFGFVE